MKLASKLMFSCLMILLGVSSIYAQKANHKFGNMNPEEKAQKKTERMIEALGLSETQANQIYSINLEYDQKRKSLFEGSTDKEAVKAQMKELKQSQKAAIGAVLTTEQTAKMEALKSERRGKRGHSKGGKREGHSNMNPEERAQKHTQKMTEELGLSASQASQIQSVLLQYGNRKKALKENSTDRETNKAAMKELKESQKAAIQQILTPEQASKMEVLKAEHKAKKGELRGGKRENQR